MSSGPGVDPLFWIVAAAVALFATVLVSCRPFVGACLLTILYPFTTGMLVLTTPPHHVLKVFGVNLLSVVLLAALLVRRVFVWRGGCRDGVAGRIPDFPRILFFMAGFSACAFLSLQWADNAFLSFLGFLRFGGNFVIVLFLAVFVDDHKKLVRLLVLNCCVSAVFIAAAIFATYHAFHWEHSIILTPDFSLVLDFSLFNQPGGFRDIVVGLLTGYGLSGKHELGMLMMGCIFFSLFLITQNRSTAVNGLLGMLILLCCSMIYQGFAKLTVVSVFFIIVAGTLSVPQWRRKIPEVLFVFLLVNASGFLIATTLKTQHMKAMETTGSKLAIAADSGEFTVGSMSERKRIWRLALDRIGQSQGMGTGADSLERDATFGYHHGHNLFLSFAAEYGIAGLACIVALLGTVVNRARITLFRDIRPDDLAWRLVFVGLGAVLAAWMESLFDVYIWLPHLWYFLGILLASLKLASASKPPPIAA